MSAHCQVLGTTPGFGHSISHSHVPHQAALQPQHPAQALLGPVARPPRDAARLAPAASRRSTGAASTSSSPRSSPAGRRSDGRQARRPAPGHQAPLDRRHRATPTSPARTAATTPTGSCCASTTPSCAGTSTSARSAEMAKKSKIARNEQRTEVVERYAERRAELQGARRVEPAPDRGRAQRRARRAAGAAPRREPRPRCATATSSTAAPAGYLRNVRPLPRPAARDGAPRRAARRHEVQLVSRSSTHRRP